jgi:hypothetical protein
MRISSCFFALLFLISLPAPSLAGEASASPPPPASVLPSAADLPFCLEDAPRLPASTEQGMSALPTAILFPQPRCGACSSWDCRGIALFSQCANGKPYSGIVCVDIGICTADGSLQCDCRQPQ